MMNRTNTIRFAIAPFVLSLAAFAGGCDAVESGDSVSEIDDSDSPGEPVKERQGGVLLDSIELSNGSSFEFIGLTGPDGTIADVGVAHIGHASEISLADVGAEDLNALELYYALTDGGEAPSEMLDLYSAEPTERGWLAEAIAAAPALRAYCDDSWFLARHGNLQTGYNYHGGPNSGAWLNYGVGAGGYMFAERHNIDKVKLGFCVQSSTNYSHIYFKYRTSGGSTWHTAYENYYIAAGGYAWWYCNSCTNYDWREQAAPLAGATYDMGLDWS